MKPRLLAFGVANPAIVLISSSRTIKLFALLLVLPTFSGSSASAQDKLPGRSLSTEVAGELERYLAPVFAENMRRLHIPGAVFVLVKDGAIFFASGYGFSDRESHTPVEPDRTVFRVASVSKLLTATAVMQLHERGQLNIEDDANVYLRRFKIPQTFRQPVTIKNLITHTAGFDDQRIGLASTDETSLQKLGDFLERHLPPRIRPPGVEYAYSRYGIALAGYVVEIVSGIPFSDYIDMNILGPLGMDHSTFKQTETVAARTSRGYSFVAGKYTEVPFYYFNTSPEASFNTTAADMAKFMIAHLQQGSYEGAKILNPETVELMHARQFSHHPLLPGLAYGFYERYEHGQRILQHGGHIPGFVSRLMLLPELNIGIFMSCNNDEFALISRVTEAFFDRYFQEPPPACTDSLPSVDLEQLAGTYRINTYPRHSVEKLFSITQQFSIKQRDHALDIGNGRILRPVASNLFKNSDSGELSAFSVDSSSRGVRYFRKRFSFERVPLVDTLGFTLFAMGWFCLTFAASGLVLLRPVRHKCSWWVSPESLSFQRLSASACLLNMLFLLGLGAIILTHNRIDEFTFGAPLTLVVLLCLPILSVILVVAALSKLIPQMRLRQALRQGIFVASFVAVFVAFLIFLNHWNLLGFCF